MRDQWAGKSTRRTSPPNKGKMIYHILDNSRIISWITACIRFLKKRRIEYSAGSRIFRLIKVFTKQLYLLPVKSASTILLPLVILNLLFSSLLDLKFQPIALIMKFLIITLLTAGLYSSASWNSIRGSSYILKYIKNACKSRQ